MTFHEKVAATSGASVVMVKKVLAGKRNDETELGCRIWVAANLIQEGENKLLQSVKQAVKF